MKSSIKKLLYFLGILIAGIVLYTQVSFGFVPLFILLVLFLFYPLIEGHKSITGDQAEEVDTVRGLKYMGIIMLFGLMSLFAFKNYVYPKKDVYKNIDHHALRVDGLLIDNWTNFTLAGNTDDAFFDDEYHQGRLTIQSVTDSCVRIHSNRFSEPVYLVSGPEMRVFKLIDTSGFVSFRDNDLVEFVQRTPRGELINSLTIRPGHENHPSWNFLKHDRDSATYIFNGNHESIEHRFLKSGLTLSDLMAGIIPEFDPTGIIIFRGDINYDVKNRDIDKYYSNKRYYIGFTSEAKFTEIRVNGVSRNRIGNYDADIPFGKPFVIGFGTKKSETMCFGRHNGRISLEYYLPKYQHLSANTDAEDHTLMVTTSLFDGGEGEILGAYTENIALFNQFERPGNRNQMRPWYLSYKSGHTDTPINFTVYSDSTRLNCVTLDAKAREGRKTWADFNSHDSRLDSLRYESYFRGIHTTGNTGEWLVGVENFKNTTPFSAPKMAMMILFVIILSAISIRISSMTKMSVSASRELLTGAEYAAYLIVIAFLTIRCFLLWRITVFPPISSISYYEFNHFRDPALLKWLFISIVFFYGVVLLYKIYLLSFSKRLRSESIAFFFPDEEPTLKEKLLSLPRKKWFFITMMILTYGILFLIGGSGSLARLTNILIPVLIFFFYEYLIFHFYGKSYHDDLIDTQYYNPIGERLYPVLISLLNILLASGLTFIKDGGYGVMFLLFGLIISIFLISDLRFYTNNRTSSRAIAISRFALYALVFAFGWLYMRLFIWALDERIAFSIGVGCTLFVVLFLLSIILEFKDKLKWWWWLVAFCVIAGVSFGIYFGAGKLIDGSHMEYRTRVHMAPPSEILATAIDDNVSQNKFMQASLNDFVLQEYSEIGKDVHPFKHKTEYFKIQPQSKLGAMWFAQTTDIALSRFIIAEHSHWLAILLVVALFVFFLVGSRETCNHRASRFIQIGVPLLLFLQAGLILFANTRLFVFFGQDFPLISVTSKLSSVYFFTLLTLYLVSVLRERDFVVGGIEGEEMPQSEREELYEYDWPTSIKLAFVSAGVILMPLLASVASNWKKPMDTMDGKYSLDELMVSVHAVKDSLNSVFTEYQRTHPLGKIKTDMSVEMAQFKADPAYVRFMDYEKNDEAARDSSKFATRIIENFMTKGSHHNSAKGLVHLRTERTYDTGGHPHDVLVFDVNDDFYEYQLPKKSAFSWKGSIIGDGFVPDPSAMRSQSGDITIVKLKKEWLRNQSRDLALVHTAGSTVRVMGENSVVDISRRAVPTVVISGKDNILNRNRSIPVNIIPRDNYYARNVMVNGMRTFLYPYGSQMFWVREFANQIKYSKETLFRRGNKLATKEEKAHFDDDVPITISETLSRSIYSIYAHSGGATDRTVVVADGDGHIKAMVDYRGDKDYRLNPNNEREISRLVDEIYLKGLRRSTDEQRYFSTFATSPLRLGPGSSQKPITWTAVTSGYNTGFWSSLYISIKSIPFGKDYLYPKFAGQSIQKAFASLGGDEGHYGTLPITLEWYMYKSSNYYNAMMAYFGLYTKDQLQSLLPDSIPTQVEEGALVKRATNREDDEDLFPIMHADWGAGYNRFSFANTLRHTDFSNRNALLAYGLEHNLGIPLKRDYSESLYPSVKQYGKNKKEEIIIRPSYRQVSFFNMGIRDQHTRGNEMMEIGVRTVALGNNTSWIVSPVKMAEMYGRLITLNKNYALSLDPTSTNEYQLFDLDGTWAPTGPTARRAYQEERQRFIYGLSNVFARNVNGQTNINGTANAIATGLSELNVSFDNQDNRVGNYYVYGKTGTIDAKWGGIKQQDHLLAVVITDTKISATEDLSGVKFYVLYFADYGKKGIRLPSWQPIDRAILEAVIRSEDFRNYMGQHND